MSLLLTDCWMLCMARMYEPKDLGSSERKLCNELELNPLKFIATALAQRVCGDGVDVTADQVQRALYTLEDLWNGSEYASEVPNEKHKRYILTGKDVSSD